MWLFTLLDKWTNYRLRRWEMQLEAQNAPYRAIETAIQQLTTSNKESIGIVKTWMEQFTVRSEPQSTVVRDVDEYLAEQLREKDTATAHYGDEEWQTVDIAKLQHDLHQQLD